MQVELVQVFPENYEGNDHPSKHTFGVDQATNILKRSKGWKLIEGSKFDFTNGVIHEKGKPPPKKEGGIWLKSKDGDEKEFDFRLAEKVLKKSADKGIWGLAPSEDRYKFENNALVKKAVGKKKARPAVEETADN